MLRKFLANCIKLQNKHADGLFIVNGDFNHTDLKTVFPKFHQYVE